MKKNTLFLTKKANWLKLLLLLVGLLGVIVALNYFRIFGKNIHFTSNLTETEFILSRAKGGGEIRFKTPSTLRLNPGKYLVRASNQERYVASAQVLQVSKAETVELDFDFNSTYYHNQLRAEQQHLAQQIRRKYPKLTQDRAWLIAKGQFFNNATYYATSIGKKGNIAAERDDDSKTGILVKDVFIGNVYHLIFQKVDGKWQQITHPELILSALDYPKIPLYILQQVNDWTY